jgi:hypothetical protein
MKILANVIRAPRNEKGQIDEMVAMKGTPAVGGPIGTQPALTRLKPAPRVTPVSSAPSIPKAGGTQFTIEMARIVIRNSGRPLAVQAISEKIRSTFGLAVSKSLPDLLLRRARSSKSGFYLTTDGLIGLIETAPIVSMPRAIR